MPYFPQAMKALLFTIFALFATLSFAAVYKEAEFLASLEAWELNKPTSYQYTIVQLGESSIKRTTIRVRNNKVVARIFTESDFFHEPGQFIDSWTERCSAVGTRTGDDFYDIVPGVLFDDVYTFCHDNILTADLTPEDEEESEFIFTTFDNGFMSECSYYPAFCFGCETSIVVESITF